jgi:UDPglucose 6-dehydrogenase
MKLTLFGTWYVWLVTGTCLAEVGHEVMCIDVDSKKIENLKKWIIPIYEPGLSELVLRNYREGRLHFSTDAQGWVEFADVIFSAVGTPQDENHKADLKYVKAVAETVGKYMNGYKVFINKSTVPVGTWKLCAEIIKKNSWKEDFNIVSNPEFLKEWVAVRDFMLPDRIVCGVESEKAKKIMEEIYKPFLRAERPIVFMSIESAEICKYASNAFLATKISFINEIANFAELVGGNVTWWSYRKSFSPCRYRIWRKLLSKRCPSSYRNGKRV